MDKQRHIFIQCPYCGCRIKITEDLADRKGQGQCSKCSGKIKLPGWDKLLKKLENAESAAKYFSQSQAETPQSLTGVTVAPFLEFAEMEAKSYTLKVVSKRRKGVLYILEGALINAEYGDKKGIEAAYEIVCWENANIDIDVHRIKSENVIDVPLNRILLEGHRRKDEMIRKRNDPNARKEVLAADKRWAFEEKLKKIAKIDDIILVALLGKLYELIAFSDNRTGTGQIESIVPKIFESARRITEKMGFDKCELIHIEAEKANVFVKPLLNFCQISPSGNSEDACLVLALRESLPIGMAKMKLTFIIQFLFYDKFCNLY